MGRRALTRRGACGAERPCQNQHRRAKQALRAPLPGRWRAGESNANRTPTPPPQRGNPVPTPPTPVVGASLLATSAPRLPQLTSLPLA